jgi:hypothetical protein
VYLEVDNPSLLKETVAAFDTKALSAYIISSDPLDSDLHLRLNGASELLIQTPAGHFLKIQFDNPKKEKGIESLKDKLKKLARIRELKGLQSPFGSTLPVEVKISIWNPDKACLKGANCVSIRGLGWYRKTELYRFQEIERRILSQGDILHLTLSNKSKQDYYCYLINISPDGAIQTLFPPEWEQAEFARIKQGEGTLFGDGTSRRRNLQAYY